MSEKPWYYNSLFGSRGGENTRPDLNQKISGSDRIGLCMKPDRVGSGL